MLTLPMVRAWADQYTAHGSPPRYLLAVDTADGAVLSTGNPDTARNVATMVQGVTAGRETRAYQALVQCFRDAGWTTVPDKAYPDEVTRAYTPDGYALIAQLNSKGGLSLTGSSPCFPATNDTTTTRQPTAIPHPAG